MYYTQKELKEMGIDSFTGFYSTAQETLNIIKKEIIALHKECNKDVKDFHIFHTEQGDVSFCVWKEDGEYYATASLKKVIAKGKGLVITEAITNMFVDYYGYNFKGDFNHLQKVIDSCKHWGLEYSNFCNERWD